MGWASGSELMDSVIKAAKVAIPTLATRKKFYTKVIDAFQDRDWDTEEECMGADPAFDAALKANFKKRGIDLDEANE